MEELIKRLEEATEGARELDGQIALKFGWSRAIVGVQNINGATESVEIWIAPKQKPSDIEILPDDLILGRTPEQPYYTTSLDAALTLVPEGCGWHVAFDYEPRASASVNWDGITLNDRPIYYRSQASTAPLALCIAALRAHKRGR